MALTKKRAAKTKKKTATKKKSASRPAKKATAKKPASSRRTAPKRKAAKKAATRRPAPKPARKKVGARKPAVRKAAAARKPAARKPAAARKAAARKPAVPGKKVTTPSKSLPKGVTSRLAVAPSERKHASGGGKAAVSRAAATKAAPAEAVRRRDGSGHLEPHYEAELRRLIRDGRQHDPEGFLGGPGPTDPLAEQLGEEYVETVTSAEDEGEDVLYQDVPEEVGGPFVITPAGTEFAGGVDASNPKGAKREPFPRT